MECVLVMCVLKRGRVWDFVEVEIVKRVVKRECVVMGHDVHDHEICHDCDHGCGGDCCGCGCGHGGDHGCDVDDFSHVTVIDDVDSVG